MKKLTFLMILLWVWVVFISMMSAQTITWQRTYPYGFGSSVCQTSDSGFITACFQNNRIVGFKVDRRGNLVFSRQYGNAYCEPAQIIETSDRNFLIVGTLDDPHYGRCLYLIKANPTGESLWTKAYQWWPMSNWECWGTGVAQTSDGGYIAVGYTDSLFSNSQIYVVKTDNTGNIEWQRIFGTPNADEGASDILVGENYYLVLCNYLNYSTLVGYPYLLKLNQNGDLISTEIYDCFPARSSDRGNSIQRTFDGYLITGAVYISTERREAFLAIKINLNLQLQWYRVYDFTPQDDVAIAGFAASNGYWLAGTIHETGMVSSQQQICLLRLNFSGDTLYRRIYYGANGTRCQDAQPTNDDGIIITGYVFDNPALTILIKTNSDGNVDLSEEIFPVKVVIKTKIFSNPTRVVNFLKEDRALKIFDINGRWVEKVKVSSGIYFIRDPHHNTLTKIIIIRP